PRSGSYRTGNRAGAPSTRFNARSIGSDVLLQSALCAGHGVQIRKLFKIPSRLIELQCGTASRPEIERADEAGRIDVSAIAIVQYDVHCRVAGREIDHKPIGIRTEYMQIRHS